MTQITAENMMFVLSMSYGCIIRKQILRGKVLDKADLQMEWTSGEEKMTL